MHILTVASECFPLVKTGGLADVAGALPAALTRLGHEVQTVLPAYPGVLEQLERPILADEYGELYGGPARIVRGSTPGGRNDVFVIDAPHLFARRGHPYLAPDGKEWWDNGFRFAALAVVGRELALGRLAGYRPDVVHAHDWQAGLVPAYLAFDGRPPPASVMTVHNLAFQGQMPPDWLASLGLPAWGFQPDGFEYYGGIGFLKAGLYYADQITTVSPTYALDIQGSLWGMGMQGLLAARAADLTGIVNGIDDEVWNPASDAFLEPTYDALTLDHRAVHKRRLQERFGLHLEPRVPLFAVISRLTWQKGTDVLLDALGPLVGAGGQLAVLGSGEPSMHGRFAEAAATHPGRVGCVFGYDEALSHVIQGGADAIVMPSRYEPCGLPQLYGLRYGCVPLVGRTGGLVDTVVDVTTNPNDGTGFVADAGNPSALVDGFTRAIELYRQPEAWRAMQRRGMALDLGWDRAARAYVAVYERALERRR